MVTAEDVINCLDFVNDYRKALNLDLLVDLPKGLPEEPTECILANAFNFRGEVTPDSPGSNDSRWVFLVTLPEEKAKVLIKWAGSRGLEWVVNEHDRGVGITIFLPQEIGNIAKSFDEWQHDENSLLRKYVSDQVRVVEWEFDHEKISQKEYHKRLKMLSGGVV